MAPVVEKDTGGEEEWTPADDERRRHRRGQLGHGPREPALAGKGYDVILWSRGAEVAALVNQHHENRAYLPGVRLPTALRASTDLHEAVDGAELVVAVVPSHAMRDTMDRAARVMRAKTRWSSRPARASRTRPC